jgi:hypothetical protein
MDDYNFKEGHNVVEAISKIESECKSYLITAPIGYNKMLDEWIELHKSDSNVTILKRRCNNVWRVVNLENYEKIEYTQYWANGLLIIHKR